VEEEGRTAAAAAAAARAFPRVCSDVLFVEA